MVDLRKDEPVSSALHLLQNAQKVLPDDRQRPIMTLQAVPELVEMFSQAWAQSQKALEESKPVIVEALVDPRKVLAEVPLKELAGVLFARIAGKFDELSQAISYRAPIVTPCPIVSAPAVGQQTAKPRLKRIAIVGLLRDQFAEVEKRVNGKAELRFIDKEHSRTDIPVVDYVIVQKHTGHKWYNAAQKQRPSKDVVFVDGGITQTTQRVYDLISRQEKQ